MPGTSGRRLGLVQLGEDGIERAHDGTDGLGGDPRVVRRRPDVGVSEQRLI
jgi:hypothetical protein